MKVSDYIVQKLIEENITHVFGITGGCIVNIFDSIGRNDKIKCINNHHEQASAMAADAYARITKNIGVCITTSGPGITNAITGVCGAYYDSIPMLVISGQVPSKHLKGKSNTRQIGFQETDVCSLFKSITKYVKTITVPEDIRYELEKAIYLAKSGRPGPVVLDICDDVQIKDIDETKLRPFYPPLVVKKSITLRQIKKIEKLINKSKKPIIIIGAGVKCSDSENHIIKLINHLNFPVLLTWGAMDLLPSDHPLLVRDFGTTAQRAGNFTVQTADLILCIGTRLDTHETGNDITKFAPLAKKIIVDIDKSELKKYKKKGMIVDIPILDKIDTFVDTICEKISYQDIKTDWFDKIKLWKEKYPICPSDYHKQTTKVNPYVFMEALSKYTKKNDIIITDAGCTLTWTMQGYKVSKNQTLFSAFNNSPMGYSLPAAIGSYFADTSRNVICITGDGGIQINIQELQTIIGYKIPIKIFIMNNHEYGMIKQTQDTWLNSRYFSTCPEYGVTFPNIKKIANAYGIKTATISNHKNIDTQIKHILGFKEAILCSVEIKNNEPIIPKLKFGSSIENMHPLLNNTELSENIKITC
jgi:acetolactate synthase-1/2/3 large subunit